MTITVITTVPEEEQPLNAVVPADGKSVELTYSATLDVDATFDTNAAELLINGVKRRAKSITTEGAKLTIWLRDGEYIRGTDDVLINMTSRGLKVLNKYVKTFQRASTGNNSSIVTPPDDTEGPNPDPVANAKVIFYYLDEDGETLVLVLDKDIEDYSATDQFAFTLWVWVKIDYDLDTGDYDAALGGFAQDVVATGKEVRLSNFTGTMGLLDSQTIYVNTSFGSTNWLKDKVSGETVANFNGFADNQSLLKQKIEPVVFNGSLPNLAYELGWQDDTVNAGAMFENADSFSEGLVPWPTGISLDTDTGDISVYASAEVTRVNGLTVVGYDSQGNSAESNYFYYEVIDTTVTPILLTEPTGLLLRQDGTYISMQVDVHPLEPDISYEFDEQDPATSNWTNIYKGTNNAYTKTTPSTKGDVIPIRCRVERISTGEFSEYAGPGVIIVPVTTGAVPDKITGVVWLATAPTYVQFDIRNYDTATSINVYKDGAFHETLSNLITDLPYTDLHTGTIGDPVTYRFTGVNANGESIISGGYSTIIPDPDGKPLKRAGKNPSGIKAGVTGKYYEIQCAKYFIGATRYRVEQAAGRPMPSGFSMNADQNLFVGLMNDVYSETGFQIIAENDNGLGEAMSVKWPIKIWYTKDKTLQRPDSVTINSVGDTSTNVEVPNYAYLPDGHSYVKSLVYDQFYDQVAESVGAIDVLNLNQGMHYSFRQVAIVERADGVRVQTRLSDLIDDSFTTTNYPVPANSDEVFLLPMKRRTKNDEFS